MDMASAPLAPIEAVLTEAEIAERVSHYREAGLHQRLTALWERASDTIVEVLRGSTAPWIAEAGYRRADARQARITLPGTFVLDGEIYPGGELTIRQGPDVEFVMA